MERIPFPQRLKNANDDYYTEYTRLYFLFYIQKIQFISNTNITLKDFCNFSFKKLPFRETCLTLSDFDKTRGFCFEKIPQNFNLDYLLDFCEYTYNLIFFSQRYNTVLITLNLNNVINDYIHQLTAVIEKIGYMKSVKDNLFFFVQKDQVVIAAAEKVDPNLSPRLFEFNHRSLKGNLERKWEILLAIHHDLEPQLKNHRIKQFNSSLEDNLSSFFNNLDLRHNNVDQNGGNYYKPFVANMKKEEIEHWYDTIYQMCLLAFLGLDYLDHKDKFEQLNQIEQLKQNIRPQKS